MVELDGPCGQLPQRGKPVDADLFPSLWKISGSRELEEQLAQAKANEAGPGVGSAGAGGATGMVTVTVGAERRDGEVASAVPVSRGRAVDIGVGERHDQPSVIEKSVMSNCSGLPLVSTTSTP